MQLLLEALCSFSSVFCMTATYRVQLLVQLTFVGPAVLNTITLSACRENESNTHYLQILKVKLLFYLIIAWY